MPIVGERVKAQQVGYSGRGFVFWRTCYTCGRGRWQRNNQKNSYCVECAAKNRSKTLASERPSKRMWDLGYKTKRNSLLYQDVCPKCGRELWRKPRNFGGQCFDCNKKYHRKRLSNIRGENHPKYKGGRYITKAGYIAVRLQPDHPFYSMADKRNHRVLEHRLVVAKAINRPLEPWEVVHHKGIRYPQGSIEDKGDNLLDNLELHPKQASHLPSIKVQQELASLRNRVEELEIAEKERLNENQ